MAEATISAAQVRKRRDPAFPGYDTYLDDRMQAVLPACLRRGTKIITNQGWINPEGAAQRIVHWLRHFGARGIKVAAISGCADHRPRAGADRHHPGERQAHLHARREPGISRGLPRRRADRRRAEARRAHRRQRTRGGPVDLHGADDVRVRLGSARSSAPGTGQRRRPPDGVRRASHRRLLRRPRLQGRARALEPRLSHRRGRAGRQRRC